MTAEAAPLRTLPRDRLSRSALGVTLPAWSRHFSLRLPLVLWWAVLLGILGFGSYLNVYMSSRISEARIQIARLAQEQALQEKLNSELLFKIGAEQDLDRVAAWALEQGFHFGTETLWLDQMGREARRLPTPSAGPSEESDVAPSPGSRIRGALEWLESILSQLRLGFDSTRNQLDDFRPLPPLGEDEDSASGGNTSSLLAALQESARVLVGPRPE